MIMEPQSGHRSWSELTWEEIEALQASGMDAVILPVGATEQHGPHLGVGMDSNLAQHLSDAVSKETGVPALPVLPYGCSLGHSHKWPGTLSLQPQTLIDVITQIGDWCYSSGFKRIFILNTHVTNFAPLRCALEVLRARYDDMMLAVINAPEISEEIKAIFDEDAQDWHANAAETALMQHLSPELVRAEKINDSDDSDRTVDSVFAHPVNRTSKNGVTGAPSKASVELGASLFEKMVTGLSETITKGLSEEPPLPHSYFSTHTGNAGEQR